MAKPLRLVVWTPSATVLDVEPVEWVHVELAGERSLTIWSGHLPMMGQTVPAALRYADGEGQHAIDLPPGIVQVDDGTVTMFLAGEDEGRGERRRFDRLAEALVASVVHERGVTDRAAG